MSEDGETIGVIISVEDKLADQEKKCRAKAGELHLDINTALLGMILYNIDGDDLNSFNLLPGPFNSLDAIEKRDELSQRTEWELKILSEILSAGELKEKIETMKAKMEIADWKTEKGFIAARDEWVGGLKKWVRGQKRRQGFYLSGSF